MEAAEGDIRTGEALSTLVRIKTPRVEAKKILALSEEDGSGSGPKFAGDEDRFFLDGIEEVLAQWNQDVGRMPPIDKAALDLPERQDLSSIKFPEEAKVRNSVQSCGNDAFACDVPPWRISAWRVKEDLESLLLPLFSPRRLGLSCGVQITWRVS